MDKNKAKIVFFGAAGASLIIAITLIILGFAVGALGLLAKILIIIAGFVCLVLAGELGYFGYLMIDANPNYFLYDSKSKRNMSVQKLTFATVNAKMSRFLASYASSEAQIWNDRILDNPYLEMPEEFKPLVAYKLVYGLAENDTPAAWACLEGASDDTVGFICDAISGNGDTNFALALKKAMADEPVNMAALRDFLVRNKKYIQSKMMRYVVNNIDMF